MTPLERHFAHKAVVIPDEQVALIGQYRGGGRSADISEHDGQLYLAMDGAASQRLVGDRRIFVTQEGQSVFFSADAEPASVTVEDLELQRYDSGAEQVAAFQASLAALSLPQVVADVVTPAWVQAGCGDLVTIGSIDPRIRIDLKYATADNFMGRPVYPAAVAALRRPVAAALLRVESALEAIGYGLLVYDAYRPWSVTKLFWDLVPEEARGFVADPAVGSNHNRGCAVDATLWDLTAGEPVNMPGRFDEASKRSATTYEGGTSLQRWHRDLLRFAMESEGFVAHPSEWWHFDHATLKSSPLLDVAFEQIRQE